MSLCIASQVRSWNSASALLFAAVLAVGIPSGLRAQSAVIHGYVLTDDGRPVVGASVQLRGTSRAAQTAESGRFTFAWLEPGVHWLDITALGYAPRADSVLLGPDATVELEARLSADPVALPDLIVNVRTGPTAAWLASRGVPQRAATANGIVHATRRDLTFQGIHDLRNLIRRAPSVRLRELADHGSQLLIEPSPLPDGSPCVVGVYLNGVALSLGRLSEINFRGAVSRAPRPLRFDDLVAVDDIDAVELYGPEDSPVASESDCGALLIWSTAKRRDWDDNFRGAIHGTVIDEESGQRIRDARITLEPGGTTASSDASGAFAIENLLPGEYVLKVERSGADPWQATVRIQAFGIVTVDLRVTSRLDGQDSNYSQEHAKARINFR